MKWIQEPSSKTVRETDKKNSAAKSRSDLDSLKYSKLRILYYLRNTLDPTLARREKEISCRISTIIAQE